jgi:hypothetical protein
MAYVDDLARRIDAVERPIIALAFAAGHPELGTPFPQQPRPSEHQSHTVPDQQPFHIQHDDFSDFLT